MEVQADLGHSVPHLQACVIGRNVNERTASSIHDVAVGMSQQQHKKLVDAPLCHQKPDGCVAREVTKRAVDASEVSSGREDSCAQVDAPHAAAATCRAPVLFYSETAPCLIQ